MQRASSLIVNGTLFEFIKCLKSHMSRNGNITDFFTYNITDGVFISEYSHVGCQRIQYEK